MFGLFDGCGWLVVGGWWPVVGCWWLVVGVWLLVMGMGIFRKDTKRGNGLKKCI